ncbi:MAG: hypothetical protein OEO23_14420 [Gemmatimonadota bacterium]|nr:hypothetical protein [Gemmatimonadota bacterium]
MAKRVAQAESHEVRVPGTGAWIGRNGSGVTRSGGLEGGRAVGVPDFRGREAVAPGLPAGGQFPVIEEPVCHVRGRDHAGVAAAEPTVPVAGDPVVYAVSDPAGERPGEADQAVRESESPADAHGGVRTQMDSVRVDEGDGIGEGFR